MSGRNHVIHTAITVYNPLSLIQQGRISEIAQHLGQSAVVAMPGTCMRSHTPHHNKRKIGSKHTLFSWGTDRSDPKSGVAILVNNGWFSGGSIRQIFDPPIHLKGRAGGILLKSNVFALLVIIVYFKPEPDNNRSRFLAHSICEWTDSIISTMPQRVTPITLTDLNSEVDASANPRPDSNVFPQRTTRGPNNNAIQLGVTLGKHFMQTSSSFVNHAPTFYGTTWTSHIDFICFPEAIFPHIRKVYVDQEAGDRLQLIVPRIRTQQTLARRDHRPLTVVVNLSLLQYEGEPRRTREVRWDKTKMIDAVRFGTSRLELFEKLEAWLRDEWQCDHDAAPDTLWRNLPMQSSSLVPPFLQKIATPRGSRVKGHRHETTGDKQSRRGHWLEHAYRG